MSSNIPQPKSRLTQPGTVSGGLRKPASSSALKSSTTSRPASSKSGTGVPSTPTTSRKTPSTTTRPTLRNATSHSSLTPSTNPVPRVNSPHRPAFRSTASNGSNASTSSNRTTRPPPLKSPSKSPAKPLPSDLSDPFAGPKTALSLKEIIAQKRAEAKKALTGQQQRTRPNSALAGGRSGDSAIGDGDLLPEDNDWNGGRGALSQQEEEDLLGRRSVKESIERARETGSLNLTSRSLSHLPTSLFSIHLSVDPELLPGQTASSQEESTPHRQLAYYEAVDLTSLKARDNAITHLQPEISLFGSLKVLDFAKNQLSSLPDSIGELACLVHLDLSENKFEQFPENAVTYLPALSSLDLSKNNLKTLKFVGGMVDAGPTPPSPGFGSDSFFSPSSSRNGRGGLSQPEVLPSLKTLNVADNQLTAASIDTSGMRGHGAFPPKSLVKLDLSGNPLGAASPLVAVLSSAAAPSLKELSMKKCELEEGSFALSYPAGTDDNPSARKAGRRSAGPFATLHVLDISENAWLKEQEVKDYFKTVVERGAVIGAPNESIDLLPGAVEVRLGMRDTREKWEVEAELKSQRPRTSNSNSNSNATIGGDQDNRGTDGLEEQTAGLAIGERESGAPPAVMGGGRKRQDRPKSVQKEQWEVDVDEGLHTEAGRMRKRMEEERKAAEAEEARRKEKEQATGAAAAAANSTASKGESSQAAKGTLEKYYDAASHTLALPSSKKKPAHNRHASLTFSRSAAGGGGGSADPNVPTETLPMTVIVTQPWSSTLRALHMSNRRADSVFSMPSHVRLEKLEELLLDGCALGDLVRVRRLSGEQGGGEGTDEPIFEVLGGMFPAMTTLDLSENGLTKVPGLVKLFFPAEAGEDGEGKRRGLKVLRLKGNSIADVEGLVEVAELFGRGEIEGWRGEEIDIRDNQIPKLPPVLGLLQLDVLLVEGNVFRVPPRGVWLREGTQGLLRWLRESAYSEIVLVDDKGKCFAVDMFLLDTDHSQLCSSLFDSIPLLPMTSSPSMDTAPMQQPTSTLPFILVPNLADFPSPTDVEMSKRPRPSFPIPIRQSQQGPPSSGASNHSMSISPENRLQQQLNQSNFQGPQHRHAHHLHSIPPKEKTTRTLILDHLLCLHARARFAQARAELGLDPERVASDDEDDELSLASDSECMDWTATNGGSVKDAMNARVYKARADGLEKVLSAMLEQPPEELPFDADDLLFRDTSFQPPSAPVLPNGVRLRLALAGLINDVFAEDEFTVPKDQAAEPAHFYHSPPPPLASYSPALSVLSKISSFAQHADNQRPVLPSFQSLTATTDGVTDAPPAQSIIPPPPAGSIFSSIPRGAGPESPWALGGSLGSRSSATTAGGQLANVGSSSSSSFPSTSPVASGSIFPPPSRPTARYGPPANASGDMPPPPPPRVYRAVGRSRDLYNAGTMSRGASSSSSSSSSSSRPYRCPHHLTYTCPPSSFCVSSLNAQSPIKTSKSRTRSSIGAGLSTPGPPLRRAPYYGKNQGKEARMTDLLPRFLRLSALVAVELGREERHEDEKAEALAKRKEGRSASSSSSVGGGRARAASGAGDMGSSALSTHSYDSDDDSPATAKRLAARPTKLWYKLLAGLLTRAVLQGYLVKGWKGTDPIEVLLGVGVGAVAPEDLANKDDEDVSMLDVDDEEDYEPDDMPELADAWHILFGFKTKDAPAATTSTANGMAVDDYEGLMADRISEFFTVSPNVSELSNHLDDLARKYPSQPVDRSLLKFCEAVAKWRGKPELETYKDRPLDAAASPAAAGNSGLSTSATSNLSIHQLIHPQPPPKPLIERYFVMPSKSEREATSLGGWGAASSSKSTAVGDRRDSVSSTGTKRSRRSSWVEGKGKKVVTGAGWIEDEEYVGPYGI
ncbi:hypothetical protein FRC01_014449 [Tulasnella sp. 417]|nr:hypothetical protein FRC01_014449 [Tulasnella sp. 417]